HAPLIPSARSRKLQRPFPEKPMRKSYGPLPLELPQGCQDDTSISISRPQAFDKKGKPLDELGYPLNISINRDKVGNAPDPLRYLQAKLTQMRPQLDQFKLAFVEKDQIGVHPAAKAEFSFAAHFELHQL